MPSLIPTGDGPVERCKLCGKPASGPCARCRSLVCADCCELTSGGASTFAVCLRCAREHPHTLGRAWVGLLGWLGLVVLVLAGAAALLVLAR